MTFSNLKIHKQKEAISNQKIYMSKTLRKNKLIKSISNRKYNTQQISHLPTLHFQESMVKSRTKLQ